MKRASSLFVTAFVIVAAVVAIAASGNPHGLVAAVLAWIHGTLLGNVATTLAVIAVALVGFMMVAGRLNWRFGATVVVGCCVLFGASAIAASHQPLPRVVR